MDQAGWHMTNALIVPENISIIPLPAKCPELNPVENIWHSMRFLVTVPNPYPLSQRFQIRDYRPRTLSFFSKMNSPVAYKAKVIKSETAPRHLKNISLTDGWLCCLG
jgi:hypothetical protein